MKVAVLTITRNEKFLFPVWYRHYKRWAPTADLHVIDDQSDDGHLDGYDDITVYPLGEPKEHIGVVGERLRDAVQERFAKLLSDGYDYVVFAETDEMVFPDPTVYGSIEDYIERTGLKEYYRVRGYDVLWVDDDPMIDLDHPILKQRTVWAFNWKHFCKVLIGRVPLRWGVGFHHCHQIPSSKREMRAPRELAPNLYMAHFQWLCPSLTHKRWQHRRAHNMIYDSQPDFAEVRRCFEEDHDLAYIPGHFKDAV